MTDHVPPLELHVLEHMLRDLDGPGLRALAEYEQAFSGFEGLVRICYSKLTTDDPSLVDATHETQLGPFTLLEVAGQGGQGTVWRARDDRLGRTVAVKVLTAQLALTDEESSKRLRQRFEREAIAAARLDDPGICGVHEVGEQAGVPWIARA
jgi:serine/threonine protein kinase